MAFSKHRDPPPKKKGGRAPRYVQREAQVYAKEWREAHANANDPNVPKLVRGMERVRASTYKSLLHESTQELREVWKNSTTGGMGPKNPNKKKGRK